LVKKQANLKIVWRPSHIKVVRDTDEQGNNEEFTGKAQWHETFGVFFPN